MVDLRRSSKRDFQFEMLIWFFLTAIYPGSVFYLGLCVFGFGMEKCK